MIKKSIIEWNVERHKKSFSDGTYRGEEGILRLSPETGRLMGLKVILNTDYLSAMELYKKADTHFKAAVEAMSTQKREKIKGEHSERVGEQALQYSVAIGNANNKIKAYHSMLTAEADERLNDAVCNDLLDKLLEESLKAASFNLRDALAILYNRCRGLDVSSEALNTENVIFVNQVFREVTGSSSEQYLVKFDLDSCENTKNILDSRWKYGARVLGSRYSPFLKSALEANENSLYPVDPLLFIALMKGESSFNALAVSDVGAAGLTQIMPDTAKSLGMKNVFIPPYFHQARSLMKQEQELRRKAVNLIPKITQKNIKEYGNRSRELMQNSIDMGRKRMKMFTRYRQELLVDGADERLDPQKSIEHGFSYFLKMMNLQEGDMSLALASYNAGPSSVKKHNGLPPYSETVSFRNRVLRYYSDYLRGANK
ncbi:MAG: lytic transglycosylase domain-containing protein [Deltaproteobacteria bacterium]|nr:lytic transglycosylase domain-containing protein [Deltaproteobacteria bacterium]